MDLSQFRIN